MRSFEVEITETLQRIVTVEANSEEEAEKIVRDKYRNDGIVLESSDFIDKAITVIGGC